MHRPNLKVEDFNLKVDDANLTAYDINLRTNQTATPQHKLKLFQLETQSRLTQPPNGSHNKKKNFPLSPR